MNKRDIRPVLKLYRIFFLYSGFAERTGDENINTHVILVHLFVGQTSLLAAITYLLLFYCSFCFGEMH